MDPGFSIPEHSDLLELDVDEDETLVPQDKETFGERPDHDDSTSKKQLQSELIDKFIISNPRMNRKRIITPSK